jgi:serine protease
MDIASFSQRNRNVDIAAPGVDVLSTFPTDGCQICDRLDVVKYGVISGTSMATPHVAGVASLLRAQFPDVPASEIADALISSAMVRYTLDTVLVATKTCTHLSVRMTGLGRSWS